MKIFDKEFAFSSLNANDIERLEQAKAKLEKAEAAERQRAQQTPNMSYAEASAASWKRLSMMCWAKGLRQLWGWTAMTWARP